MMLPHQSTQSPRCKRQFRVHANSNQLVVDMLSKQKIRWTGVDKFMLPLAREADDRLRVRPRVAVLAG
jgi:hypothetical protein